MSLLVTVALTGFFRNFVFVIGQLPQMFFLETIPEQREAIGEATHALVFDTNVSDVAENRPIFR